MKEDNDQGSVRTNAVSQEETAKSEPEQDTFNQALEVIKESSRLGKREMRNQRNYRKHKKENLARNTREK